MYHDSREQNDPHQSWQLITSHDTVWDEAFLVSSKDRCPQMTDGFEREDCCLRHSWTHDPRHGPSARRRAAEKLVCKGLNTRETSNRNGSIPLIPMVGCAIELPRKQAHKSTDGGESFSGYPKVSDSPSTL